MVGKARTEAMKHLDSLHDKRAHENKAAEAFTAALREHQQNGGPKPTFRGFAKLYGLNDKLLAQRVNNLGTSKWESNASKGNRTWSL